MVVKIANVSIPTLKLNLYEDSHINGNVKLCSFDQHY